ncbi:hypothetical protein PARPLA_02599 [Rhodobacteraceae bacterium THAF1]|uniref:PRC-barrel domain-containing protein n=1 Tax=Palleronia sp. THAF1 TaxID=2587842 RepID=UPI000F3E015D|nr:PRC-barrel domain-containing protein [Palleronia sp. THAF1]QFU08078.1 hypothetical protein FIU81_05270 [Palleronia sp. THAF1]VDC27936.1 hypothetical protein PARPLA_02599 [Rhodobacteraceae bacterium THAF1]
MRLVLATLLALPLPALAQDSVPVEDAPFKEAGNLASRLEGTADMAGPFSPVPPEAITTELVTQAEVLDVAGNRIGSARGVLIERDVPVALVFEVGGVFGVFERPVAVPLIDADIGQSATGAIRIILDITAAELQNMDRYEGPPLAE